MKDELRKIYGAVARGELSKAEALNRIRAVKLQLHVSETGVVLAVPTWQSGREDLSTRIDQFDCIEHYIFLCELPRIDAQQLETLIACSESMHVREATTRNAADRFDNYASICFARVQGILKNKPQGKVLLQIVVSNDRECALFAGLSGLLRTARLENPQFIGQVILTDAETTTEQLAARLQGDRGRSSDTIIKYEQGERYVLGWEELPEKREAPKVPFKDRGIYLITGGLGGLGLLFTKEILQRTRDARIILTGRSAITSEKQALLMGMSEQVGQLQYRQLDIGNLTAVRELIASLKSEYRGLNGILHSAGMIADNFILKKTAAEFSKVLAPKVLGTFNLDAASHDTDLDFFVLFSSLAGAMGNVGQADYATANSFMDQFSTYRNQLVNGKQRYGRTLSMNWPLWQDGGMSIAAKGPNLLHHGAGLQTLQSTTGMSALYRSLESQVDQALVLEGDVLQLRRALFDVRMEMTELSDHVAENQSVEFRTVDVENLAEKTEEYLRKQFSALLKLPSHRIDAAAPLEKYGIDSMLALSLTNRLEKTFGSLSKTLFFEYQTIREASGYFIKSHAARLAKLFASPIADDGHAAAIVSPAFSVSSKRIGSRRFKRQEAVSSTAKKLNDANAIAIIGLSGRYPEAVNIEVYWHNLREGKDCVVEVPKTRWDWRDYFSEDRSSVGHHFSKWGGFISGVDEFDPLFFNISPKDAKWIDPQERLFLQHAWMAVEDAGYSKIDLQIPNDQELAGEVGVYVGVMYSEYQLFGAEASVQGMRMGAAPSVASISNRVSYALNLHGPSMTLDTMCSSSLTAIHIACQDLKQGRTSLAIAGGVNVSIHPNKYLLLSAGQFISSDGRCQSFGEGGEGYIPGEGVGVVVLKRLSEAERDGDHVYGVIKGSALNHGGKTNAFTVPNPRAQASAISRALAESNTDPRHVSYIEAHGTGTKLGDPIEIAALTQAFRRHTQDSGFCLIGSAKSNIGHCESAAGIAGLTKILLQLRHGEIVPSLHSAQLNPYIDFPSTPFVVNQRLSSWERPIIDGRVIPRIAGLSSFGAGGANAHVIVEEYVPLASAQQRRVAVGGKAKVIIVLSARKTEQLKQRALDLLEFIRNLDQSVDLLEVAYTLQVGRNGMEQRLGLIVASFDELTEKLEGYVQGKQEIEDLYEEQVKGEHSALSLFNTDVDLQNTIDKWIADSKFSNLLQLWVQGLELDWSKLYGESKPRRISLPTYPFAKDRYWIDTVTSLGSVAKSATALHPLLHANTSDLSQQSYGSTFSGEEFFFVEQQGEKTLSVTAQLEMARAAVEKARPASQAFSRVALHKIVWGQPLVVAGSKAVTIALLPQGERGSESDQVAYEIYGREGDEEIIHCQGQAIYGAERAPARLNIAQLKIEAERLGGSKQWVSEVRLSGAIDKYQDDYILHPSLLDGALQGALDLISGVDYLPRESFVPAAIESVHIFSACKKEMIAWVRRSTSSGLADEEVKLDIDLCDLEGDVCVQMEGMSYRRALHEVAGKGLQLAGASPPMSLVVAAPVSAKRTPRKISFAPGSVLSRALHSVVKSEVELNKPSGISLAAPGAAVVEFAGQRTVSGISVSLSKAADVSSFEVGVVLAVSLYEEGDGIYAIRVSAPESENTLSSEVIEQLLQALQRATQEGTLRVLVLSGTERYFLRGGRKEHEEAVERKLYRAIAAFPYPTIAVMQGAASGAGFLAGALCDFMICNMGENYGYSNPLEGFSPSVSEAMLFEERLGAVLSADFLDLSAATGQQLKAKGWTCPILSSADVEAYAQQLASSLAAKSQEALRLLKQHLGRHILRLVEGLTSAEVNGTGHVVSSLPLKATKLSSDAVASWTKLENSAVVQENDERAALPEPTIRIALRSKVVTATAHPDGIVIVTMEDREAKNMFSEALVTGLEEVFAHIDATPAYKVVILKGYDNYFASGGTKESLLAIQEGKVKFTDRKIYQIAMDCKIPVIAAMQGHGIGAGWVLGMFADFVLMSEESRYVSPYMEYGFTPGAGSTLILPEKMGYDVGRESLLTAHQYSGAELRGRGLGLQILPRRQIEKTAIAIAKQLTRCSRAELTSTKDELVRLQRESIDETCRLELAMHEKTFVGHADTLERIGRNFLPAGGELVSRPSGEMQASTQEDTQRIELANESSEGTLPTVTAAIKKLLAAELQMGDEEIDESTSFIDLGLDSITGVTWMRKINVQYGTSIEATKIYSHPTLQQLGRYVQAEVRKQDKLVKSVVRDAPVVSQNATVSSPTGVSQLSLRQLKSWRGEGSSQFARSMSATPLATEVRAIAVIGMAGQFPQAKNVEEFWRNIAEGRNCITTIPTRRWDINTFYQPGAAIAGKTNSQWMGSLEEYDLFDPLFFNISPTEAESMDPQQRVFLQACWQCIEDAGYSAKSLFGSKCGVFVGCAAGEYQAQLSAQGFTGNATSILAARISYFLNLQGPCLSIDTACSSSLVAIASGCDSLNTGGSDLVLAGGVYVMGGPGMHIMTAQAGMLSPNGRCFSFDQRANGFVPGEAVGVVMLKRLSDAQIDCDLIYGVIEGWGVNQDGKTNGITAPSAESQTRLQQDVYDKYGIDPTEIQLIEAHGTGTKLGDPIEVEGLRESFKKYTQEKNYCALGSVKSNIGHCLTAAGISGFIKVLLALKHKQLPPTINFNRLNEHIGLVNSPFYINSRLQEWIPQGSQRRRAAISSFGFSGTNAHLVIGEHRLPVETQEPVSRIVPHPGAIVPLSARNEEQLKQRATDLLAFIRREGQSIDLVEIAYTLQVGREPMVNRWGLLVSSIEQLDEKLTAYIDGKLVIEGTYRGQVKHNKEGLSIISENSDMKELIVGTWIAQGKLDQLLDLWAKGVDVDWNKLYGAVKPRRTRLPTYSFSKDRYWFEETANTKAITASNAARFLHPLVHVNTSNLSQQSYRSVFSGEEFFLKDHPVRAPHNPLQKVLPGMAYLEMARAAIEQALPHRREAAIVELRNIEWVQQMAVADHKEISIAMTASDDDSIEYEIYSSDSNEEVVYCQGHAALNRKKPEPKRDVEQLKSQMLLGKFDSKGVYAAFVQMGLRYGPAHQGITAIHFGESQLLAQLQLSAELEINHAEYVLHPGLMDNVLQAAVCLCTDMLRLSGQQFLPLAIESLQIVAACTARMVAWVRYSNNSQCSGALRQIDIDLCDSEGNLCVLLKRLTLQQFSSNGAAQENSTEVFETDDIAAARPATQTREISKQLFFQEHWQERSKSFLLSKLENERFIIFADSEFREQIIGDDAHGQFAAACWVYQAESYRQVSAHSYGCRFDELSDTKTVFDSIAASVDRPEVASNTVVYAWARDRQEPGIHSIFKLFGAIKASLLPVTQVILVGHYDPLCVDTCWDYSWIGFERSLKHLLPLTRVSLLYSSTSSCTAPQLLDAARIGGAVWYTEDQRLELSYKSVDPASPISNPILKESGTYLITGGCGALGLKFARNLAEKYHAKLILLGRRELTSSIQEQLDLLLEAGAEDVRYYAVDICNRSALTAWIENIPYKIMGVIHAAGIESNQLFFEKSTADVNLVLHPKSHGILMLDEILNDQPLDFVSYFASTSALFGDLGACDYAVGNRFLMAYGLHRQLTKRAGKTAVFNWPLWAEGGMGWKDRDQAERYLKMSAQEYGNEPLSTEGGISIWHHILQTDQLQTGVIVGKPSKVEKFLNKVYENKQSFRPAVTKESALNAPKGGGYKYANKVEEVYSLVLPSVDSEMEYLTFCPFEFRIPGFSMSLTYLNPKKYSAERRYVQQKQTEMRQVLFCKENFQKINSVLDFGCGHGTDVIQIGSLFPEIQVHGFTITGAQARLGNQRIARKNLDSRVRIYNKDSTSDSFPSKYDLIFGIEVCPHIEDKDGLFRNICSSLNDNGVVLLMDVLSGHSDSIVDPHTGMYVPTEEEWSQLVSKFGFEVEEFIDVSPQVANFLYDPAVEGNVRNLPEAVQKTYLAYAGLSAILEKGFARYVLVRLKRNSQKTNQELEVSNRDKVRNATPYSAALAGMLERAHVGYPRPYEASSIRDVAEAKDLMFSGHLESEPGRPVVSIVEGNVSGREDKSVSLQQLQRELRVGLAETLHLKAESIDLDQSFGDFGLDSFLGVQWTTTINVRYGTSLPNIAVYDYPSIRQLASFVEDEIAKLSIGSPKLPERIAADSKLLPSHMPSSERKMGVRRNRALRRTYSDQKQVRETSQEKIALIGMSGRYSQASNLHLYWENLIRGKDSVMEVPASRWDVNKYYSADGGGAVSSKWLGVVDDIDCFDPLFFRISPEEAAYMDPQHRLFLQESYRAIEDSGYSGASLSNKKCGVYLGIGHNDYSLLLAANKVGSATVTSNSHAIAPARIAYYLNLKGPAISVDTACSSSLVAVHLACQSLLSRETDMALAGGVSLWFSPESYYAMSQVGMLSPDGRCKTFDDSANGIVVGDGVGALVLKRLQDAEADNDFIYGVILGSGINQDGKSNGITAPSVNSQIELMRGIYSKHGIAPETISYVETHGTGTKLGDPIELTALATVFGEKTEKKNYCALASVKSNIGHTAAASGVASIQKVLLSLQHRTIAPTINVTKENSQFDFKNSPFYINRQKSRWVAAPDSLLRAAISSFGFSGTNAHLVIEEYLNSSPVELRDADPSAEIIVPLSARTSEQLVQKARDLAAFIVFARQHEEPNVGARSLRSINLASIAYTLQVGRDEMEERIGFVVRSTEQLVNKLHAFIAGETSIESVCQGRAENETQTYAKFSHRDMKVLTDNAIARRELLKILELWVNGRAFDWNKLYGDSKPQRLPLPAYPFAKERYWFDDSNSPGESHDQPPNYTNLESIENIFKRIADDSIETKQAVKLLHALV